MRSSGSTGESAARARLTRRMWAGAVAGLARTGVRPEKSVVEKAWRWLAGLVRYSSFLAARRSEMEARSLVETGTIVRRRRASTAGVLAQAVGEVLALDDGELVRVRLDVALCEAEGELLGEGLGGVDDLAVLLGQVLLAHAPAEEGEPVVEGGGEDAPVAVGGDVDVVVALAQLLAVLSAEEAGVGEGGRGPVEGVVEGDVLGRGDEPLGASDDVGDVHEVVVDDVGEVVGRVAVSLDEDEVVLVLALLVVAVDAVDEGGAAALSVEADDVGFAGGGAAFGLGDGDGAAGSWVVGGAAALEGLLLVALEVVG